MTSYQAVNALSVPRYDDDGKLTNKNYFVRGGDRVPDHVLDQKHHKDFVAKALERGSLKELSEQETQEPEAIEGSEVNGPGVAMLSTIPNPDAEVNTTYKPDPDAEGEGAEAGPKRPAKSASLEDLRAYATVRGVEFEDKDTRADLNRKIDQADKAQPQG